MTDLQIVKISIQQLKAVGFGSQKEIGYKLGYKNESSFSQVLNGKVPLPSDLIDRITALPNLPETIKNFISDNRVTASGPRLEAKPTRLYPDPLEHDDKRQKIIHLPDGTVAMRVPIVPARAYAGYMVGFADPEYYDDLDDILIGVDKEPNGTYIGFEVVGRSMVCLDTDELAEESIFPGRIAIGRDLPKENWKTKLHTHNYKNWIFVHRTEGILIKQIANHDVENGIVTIHSLNPEYPDQDLLLSDMQQIFSVIQIVQRTRPKPR